MTDHRSRRSISDGAGRLGVEIDRRRRRTIADVGDDGAGRTARLGRRTSVLILVGVLLTNLSMVSLWSWRTFASSQGFADATTDMLKEPAVREVVAQQIVD